MKNKINKKTETYRKYSSFYLLLLPGLIYFALFKYAPMYGVIIAFKNYSVFSGIIESDWVGFDVFKRLFSIPGFKRAFTNTITISLLKTITGFPLSIFIALLFNELTSRKGKKLLQTAIILPHFVSWVIISGLIYALLSPNVGLIKDLYRVFGISKKPIDLLTSGKYFRTLLVVSHSWRNAGFASIMYTAAIAGIPPELYESAIVDGAGRLKQALHVTLPGIRNTILILVIFRVGGILNADFEQVFVLSNPVVQDVSDIIDTYVYRIGLQQAQFSLSTAADLFKTIIALVLILATNQIARRIEKDAALF